MDLSSVDPSWQRVNLNQSGIAEAATLLTCAPLPTPLKKVGALPTQYEMSLMMYSIPLSSQRILFLEGPGPAPLEKGTSQVGLLFPLSHILKRPASLGMGTGLVEG